MSEALTEVARYFFLLVDPKRGVLKVDESRCHVAIHLIDLDLHLILHNVLARVEHIPCVLGSRGGDCVVVSVQGVLSVESGLGIFLSHELL